MAQGKLKVKSKGGSLPPSKKKHEKKAQGIKKGKLSIAPKKLVRQSCLDNEQLGSRILFQQHQEAYKFKKNVQKLINANIEKEVKEKAQNFDKKEFLAVNKEAGASKN